MRVARVQTPSGPVPVSWDGAHWREIASIFDQRPMVTGRSWPAVVGLDSPADPRVVVGMSANGAPTSRMQPARSFLKSARSVVAPGVGIAIDSARGLHAIEGELAVVFGADARNVPANRVSEVILGYTIGNDVTAADQILVDPTFTHGKNGDGFTPLGPWIETDIDPNSLGIHVSIDGIHVVHGSTSELGRTIAEQIEYVTSFMSLGPGDVLLTGCPGTTAIVHPGQIVTISIDGLGELTSPVIAESHIEEQHEETL